MHLVSGIHLCFRLSGELASQQYRLTAPELTIVRGSSIFLPSNTTNPCRRIPRKLFNKELSVRTSTFYLFSNSIPVLTRGIFSNYPKTNKVVWKTNNTFKKPVFGNYSTFRRVNRKILGALSTMKLDSPEFHRLFTPELELLVSLFKKYGYELRIAGGAVRDLINGTLPADIDFATTATPDQMKAMFDSEQIRMINTKGEKHGTITARINDKENFEVTTLRIDVETDGRHAKVEFTKDWKLDANRRDLTVNAMFLGFDGTVYDYFNGKEDLEQRKVCFVGEATERIKEDYLRILRYFRFCGRICENKIEHDPEALAAIQDNMHGLSDISGERIWSELKKIVTGGEAGSLMQTMLELGMTPYIGLPKSSNAEEFIIVWNRARSLQPLPMTMMSALLHSESEVNDLNQRLKLSTDEVKLGYFIVHNRLERFDSDPLRTAQNIMVDSAGKDSKVKERLCELFKYKGHKEILQSFSDWDPPKFPVTGYDLVSVKVPKGPVFAKTLNELRQVWKESNFSLSKDELMSHVQEIVQKFRT